MEKKASSIAVLKILQETDENCSLTEKEINKKLNDKYGISIDRRTFYNDVELLRDFDYEIETHIRPSDNKHAYYLASREFEESEINLLCNAVHSSKFIPKGYSKDLVKKLLKTQGKSFKKKYTDEVFIDDSVDKKDNLDFFLNIDYISEAIRNHHVISFDYVRYDENKQLVPKSGGRRIISPHHLVYTNDKIYLIGYSASRNQVIHLRVDKIMDVKEELNETYVKEDKKSDPYQYIKTKLYMFTGEDVSVSIRFKKTILDDIIDSFGKNINLINDGPDYYKTTVKTSRQGIIYFALQFLENIEILDPKDIRKEIANMLKQGSKLYNRLF